MRKKRISRRITKFLIIVVSVTVLFMVSISVYSLYSMKQLSIEMSQGLGETVAEDSEKVLEEMASEHMLAISFEKAAYIEEKFASVVSYVHGIADFAEKIYNNSEKYAVREVLPPQKNEKNLSAQLLKSRKLKDVTGKSEEILKLGNIQDLLLQYNAHNEMISSTYIATTSGWIIQADYIAYSKFSKNSAELPYYEAADRQWFQKAKLVPKGEVIYTDIIADIHEGGDCIVCAQPVYVDGKIVAVAGVGSYLNAINSTVLNTKIGDKGYAFLINEKGQVIVSSVKNGAINACSEKNTDLRKCNNKEFVSVVKEMVSGKKGIKKLILDGKEVYLAYAPINSLNWSFATVLDVDEVIALAKENQKNILQVTEQVSEKQSEAIQNVLFVFLIITVLITIIISIISGVLTEKITEPIRKLTQAVAKFDGGNLEHQITISSGDEVEELGDAFNDMADKLKQYIANIEIITAEKERIRTELQVASSIQADMLPKVDEELSECEKFTMHAEMVPAKAVGGDFYDFFMSDEEHLVFLIADVSGKGVPAALFMVVAMILLKDKIMSTENLSDAVSDVNNALCKNNINGMFVTAWIGKLNINTGILEYVNAGHNRPLIKHDNNPYQYMKENSDFVLGGMENMQFTLATIQLKEGDTLFLYTDGVTETNDINQNLYGDFKLEELLNLNKELNPKEVTEVVWRDIRKFQAEAAQFDDITTLTIRYETGKYVRYKGGVSGKNLEEAVQFLEKQMKEQRISKENRTKILIVADEVLSNILKYSNAKQMSVAYIGRNNFIRVIFEDDGIPYNPLKKENEDMFERVMNGIEGGLGIYLVMQSMDNVKYEEVHGKNRLTIDKILL